MAQQLEAITVLQQQLLTAQAAVATPAVVVALVLVAAPVVVEVALPPKFNGERSQVVGFINACHLFIQMRMGQHSGRDYKGNISSKHGGGAIHKIKTRIWGVQ